MPRRRNTIEEYRQKRDFGQTPEPKPGAPSSAILPCGPPGFVVHRHEARRLHYDLRLEMEGVLRSFAIPRGFSYRTGDRHLAVRTEDHPLEYFDFHGVIPKGQYGAGTMTLWDRGRYRVPGGADPSAAIAEGKLEVFLHGCRLRGEWHLVRIDDDKDEWLLLKARDRYVLDAEDPGLDADLSRARLGGLPEPWVPMRHAEEAVPFSERGWWFEMEFDGIRVRAERRAESRALLTAAGRPLQTPGGDLARALADLRAEEAVLDAVLVALDEGERPSRPLLDDVLAGRSSEPVALYAFDVLAVEGWDLRELPLVERKKVLRSVLAGSSVLFVDPVQESGEELARAAAAAGLPGLIAKQLGSTYQHGPSAAWRRIALDRASPGLGFRESLERSGADSEVTRRRIRFTHRDKVYWPAAGIAKGELLDYYERVGPLLLPYLRDRPLHLHRYPDGIEGESFYQKNTPPHYPEWLTTRVIPTDRSQKPIRYVVCNEISALLYLANTGSIDLHPWHSRLETPDSPDWTIIDLDPKGAPFSHVLRIGRALGRLLGGLGVRSCVKTSGSTGLHVYVPLKPGYTYDDGCMFAEAVARTVAREHSDIATVERHVSQRGGKVYLDYLQNKKGQTIAPPYVARPVPGALVSTPLRWDELSGDLDPRDFTLRSAPARFEQVGDLFQPVLTDPQDLLPAIERLQELIRSERRSDD